jgi:hypothetical protein
MTPKLHADVRRKTYIRYLNQGRLGSSIEHILSSVHMTSNARFRSNGPDADRTRTGHGQSADRRRTGHGQSADSRRTGLFLKDRAQASLSQCQ